MLVDLKGMVVRIGEDIGSVHMRCLDGTFARFSCQDAERIRAALAKAIRKARQFKRSCARAVEAEKKAEKKARAAKKR